MKCLVLAVALALSAAAFGSWETQAFSVHFNEYKPDFGQPTSPFWIRGWESWDGRSGFRYGSWEKQEYYSYPDDYKSLNQWWYEHWQNRLRREQGFAAKARSQEAQGRWAAAAKWWRLAAEQRGRFDWLAQERVELFGQVDGKTHLPSLKRYLAGRDLEASRQHRKAFGIYEAIAEDPKAGFLKAYAAYGLVSARDEQEVPSIAQAYANVAERFPTSPKADAALLMAARRLIQEMNFKDDGPFSKSTEHGRAALQAKAWLTKLLARSPRSRLRSAARGWLARAEFLLGNYRQAKALYEQEPESNKDFLSIAGCELGLRRPGGAFVAHLRRLRAAQDPMDQEQALTWLRWLRSDLTKADAHYVALQVSSKPELLEPYLEFRLESTAMEPADRANMASMARRVLAKHPGTQIKPRLMARLADIEYRRRKYREALDWALKAKAAGPDEDGLALYMASSCKWRLGDLAGAEAGYLEVRRKFPKSHLALAAREPLAIIRERRGNLAGALDLYYDMGYKKDIAYMLDARMSPAQVLAYSKTSEGRKRRHRMKLAYGYRLLREGRFREAERALASIPKMTRLELAWVDKYIWNDNWRENSDIDSFYDPLVTARGLGHLTRAVEKAKGGEAKAAAMYALASHYYTKRHLLLYNADLWQGNRLYCFGWMWNETVATALDKAATKEHHREHECLMHSLQICREIVRRYPGTKVAPQAMYRAATSAYWLSELNDWWRKDGRQLVRPAEAPRWMKRLAAAYPKHPLAGPAKKYARIWSWEIQANENARLLAVGK